MLEEILKVDLSLFYFFNKTMANSIFDAIMPIITNTKTWLPIIAVFLAYQFFKCGIQGKLCIITLIIGVAVCDQVSSNLIKNLVMRPRPCHILTDINLLVSCGAGKSFPSSHAANSMMLVTIIALFYRQHKFWLPWVAVLIGFSRIVVGVHYPFDVLTGLILGALIGFVIYYLVNFIFEKYFEPKLKQKQIK